MAVEQTGQVTVNEKPDAAKGDKQKDAKLMQDARNFHEKEKEESARNALAKEAAEKALSRQTRREQEKEIAALIPKIEVHLQEHPELDAETVAIFKKFLATAENFAKAKKEFDAHFGNGIPTMQSLISAMESHLRRGKDADGDTGADFVLKDFYAAAKTGESEFNSELKKLNDSLRLALAAMDEVKSELHQWPPFKPALPDEATPALKIIPDGVAGPDYRTGKDNRTGLMREDIAPPGSGLEVMGPWVDTGEVKEHGGYVNHPDVSYKYAELREVPGSSQHAARIQRRPGNLSSDSVALYDAVNTGKTTRDPSSER